jgi:hypothetical protein
MQSTKHLMFLLFSLFSLTMQSQSEDVKTFYIPNDQIENLGSEYTEQNNKSDEHILNLTMPDGQLVSFICIENNTLSEEMKIRYPKLRTYTGISKIDKSVIASITVSDGIVSGFIHNHQGSDVEISFDGASKKYISKYHKHEHNAHCSVDHSQDTHPMEPHGERSGFMPQNGANLRTFKMAIVVTDTFVLQFGSGNLDTAIHRATTVMNSINTVFKNTLGCSFIITIVRDVNKIYEPKSLIRLDTAAWAVAHYFPNSSSYDFGHVFEYLSGGGSGAASLSTVCSSSTFSLNGSNYFLKATAVSSGVNVSTLYDIAVHEIAHQFGAKHTYNATANGCDLQRDNSLTTASAVEPGSGTTIMSYAGSCSTHDLTTQNGSKVQGDNTYFHARSIELMLTHINTQTCNSTISSGNSPPIATANPCGVTNFQIPKSTPFELTGSATDPNGDLLTYQWDQVDHGTTGGAPNISCGSTSGPIFRSYPPSANPRRIFPSLEYILNNNNTPLSTVGECLPSVARTLNFRFIARDNNIASGGIDIQSLAVTVTNTGPLQVTSPNSAVTMAAGSSQTITWNVNSTNTLSDSVNILFSADGGFTWPVLLSKTVNDGSELITLPPYITATTKGRIRIESSKFSCFKFFDVSDVDFTITSSCSAVATAIAPLTPITTTSGNALLNLGMSNNFGVEITSYSGSITTSDVPGNLYFLNGTPATCSGPSNPTYYDVYSFYVDVAGTYTISHGGIYGTVLNLYQTSFSGPSCVNHITSSATRPSGSGLVSLSNSLAASLSPNTLYFIMVSGFSTSAPAIPFNYNITFSTPAGGKVYNGIPSPASYAYTYIATNKINGLIVMSSSTSNFTSLSPGNYDINGVHYYSGSGSNPPSVNPSSWINQNINTLRNGSSCVALSGNSREVNIQECIVNVTTQASSGAGSLSEVINSLPTGCKVNFSLGVDTISLVSPITLSGVKTIDGTGQNVLINLSNSTVFTISSGSDILFKNLKIRHTNPANTSSNVVLNQGNLTLEGVEIIGNTNEALKNQGSGKVILKNTVRIKKNP